MRVLRYIFQFYINSSIHVALAVCALVGITVFEYDLVVPMALWFFIFLSTISGYNFVKYAKVAGLHHRSLTNSLKTIQIFSFLSLGVLCYFALQLPWKILWTSAAFAMLTFFYAVPVLNKKNLRNFTGIKIFIVAVVWSGISVAVPIMAAGQDYTIGFLLTFIQRFFIVIVLILPFEIRDLQYDNEALGTLPQKFGVVTAKLIGVILLVGSLVLELFKKSNGEYYFLSLICLSFLLSFLLIFSKREQTRYYASFWVEGVPIVWFIILCLLNHFLS